MVGVMTHPGVLDPSILPSDAVRKEFSEIFPSVEEMADGFINDSDVLNTIHYADLYGPEGPWKAQESPNVCKNLELCVKHGGENLHAIQLDVTWPEPSGTRQIILIS
jgi:hypothetical protein